MKLKKILFATTILLVLAIIYIDSHENEKSTLLEEENGTVSVFLCPEDNCSAQLKNILMNHESGKCAFYDLKDEEIKKALAEKKFEVLVYGKNFEGFGKKVNSKGLMHHKFCVLDEKIVVSGSYNPTANNRNHDNLIFVESTILAKNYAQEFENLKHGSKKSTKKKQWIFNGFVIENYFCPQDGCRKKVLEELSKAENSIYFITFTFTDTEISEILKEKHSRGLEVKGVIENFQNKKYWVAQNLADAGISVIVHSGDHFQHNKIFIIDNSTIITGSYNPTKAADEINDENILIIRDPETIRIYLKLLLTLTDQKEGKSLSINPTKESE